MPRPSKYSRSCLFCAEHRDYDTACAIKLGAMGVHSLESESMCCPLFKPMKRRR